MLITKQQLQNTYKLKFNVITTYHELQQLKDIIPMSHTTIIDHKSAIMYCYYARIFI